MIFIIGGILVTVLFLSITIPIPIMAYRLWRDEGPTLFNNAWGIGAISCAMGIWLFIGACWWSYL